MSGKRLNKFQKYSMRIIKDRLLYILDNLYKFRKENLYNRWIRTHVLSVGEYTYGFPNIIHDKHSTSVVNIGKFCSIADGVNIFTGSNHNTNWVTTYPLRIMLNLEGKYKDGQPSTKGDVIIGNDVWIASNVTILSGVKIGDGSVIAANTIVSRDVPPYSVVAGNPQIILKLRFSEHEITQLLKIKWWDWPIDKIREAVPLLCNDDIKRFCEIYGEN